MTAISFNRLLVSVMVLFLLFCTFDASAQKEKKFVKHPTISFGYGQAYLNDGNAGHLFSLAMDIPQDEVKFIAFEATHTEQSLEERMINSQGIVINGFKSTYALSDLRVKFGYKLLQWKLLELQTTPFASAFFERYSYEPLTTKSYPFAGKYVGVGVGGELKCMFRVEEAVGVFIGTNYTCFRLFYANTREDNPTLLERQRNKKGIDSALFGDKAAYWIVGLNLRMW